MFLAVFFFTTTGSAIIPVWWKFLTQIRADESNTTLVETVIFAISLFSRVKVHCEEELPSGCIQVNRQRHSAGRRVLSAIKSEHKEHICPLDSQHNFSIQEIKLNLPWSVNKLTEDECLLLKNVVLGYWKKSRSTEWNNSMKTVLYSLEDPSETAS